MPEVNGETEQECECPKCGHKYWDTFQVTLEFEMSDYAPDYY